MNFLQRLLGRNKTIIISAEHATILVAVAVAEHKSKLATSIQVSIPLHHSLIINNKNVIMATTFKPTGKVPFVLQWLDATLLPTLDVVTGVSGTVGDGTNLIATVSFDSPDSKTGWIIGAANGTGDLVFKGTNSTGQPIQSVPITLTVNDGTTPPPPANVAQSIGVTLGDEIPQ